MTGAVRFERRGDRYAIRFSFDPIIVALIKTVPGYARSWHPATKTWFVDATYAKQLARDMAAIGFLITGIESADGDLSAWASILFRRVGPARAGPVFRSLSKVLHPDTTTGDARLQLELNAAHAELLTDHRKESA
jgi:hypothetical protein